MRVTLASTHTQIDLKGQYGAASGKYLPSIQQSAMATLLNELRLAATPAFTFPPLDIYI
jgi:hypothetical protein